MQTILKIKSVELRYSTTTVWPWLLVYRGEHGEATLEFPFRRAATSFAHRHGWRCTEETTPTLLETAP